MRRLERLQAILILLQSKYVLTADEIAERFGVAVRTVYRDMRALEESGVPIAAEAGVGYSLAKGYTLPPVQFTQEEARALLLAEKMLAAHADTGSSETVTNAMTKIRAVLRSEGRDDVEELERRVIVRPPRSIGRTMQPDVMNVLQNALLDHSVVRLRYFTNARQTYSERDVEPIGLSFYGLRWHLHAYCRDKQGIRDFRIDRIEHAQSTIERFNPSSHPTLNELVSGHLTMEQKDRISIIVDVKYDILPTIADSRHQFGFVSEEARESCMRMTFMVHHLDYFARWLAMMEDGISVVEPDTLRMWIHDIGTRIAAHHGESRGEGS